MRHCKTCDYVGPKESFPKAHEVNGVVYRRHRCVSCYTALKTAYKRKQKGELSALKRGLSCVRCGFSDYRALQFHHRRPEEKSFAVGEAGSMAYASVLREIEKCDVLCANCHSIEHFFE